MHVLSAQLGQSSSNRTNEMENLSKNWVGIPVVKNLQSYEHIYIYTYIIPNKN